MDQVIVLGFKSPPETGQLAWGFMYLPGAVGVYHTRTSKKHSCAGQGSSGHNQTDNVAQVRALSNDVEFVVEFWRFHGTGEVDEKREGL